MEILWPSESNCCGCESCLNTCSQSAISMYEDAYGFKYPKIDQEKCIDCGACIKKCDFQKTIENGIESNRPIKAYATYHNDNEVLKKSTSGGVFTAFAEYVINQGGCVYGCIMDDNHNAKIVRGDTMGDIEPMRGSKYCQSEIGNVYKDVKSQLQNNRMVLFTGTPCQVAGLKSYLGNSHKEKLITIDLICHGVPSVKSFKMYIAFLEGLKSYKGTKIKEYKFRSKHYGWGLNTSAIEIVSGKRGRYIKKVSLSKNDFYKSNYLSWNSIRISCATCKYANNNRVGDFTMGDYWGWEKLGVNIATKQGLSVLFVNTDKWLHILNALNMKFIDSPVDIALEGNGALNKPTVRGRFWNTFMECVAANDYTSFYMGFVKFRKDRERKERVAKIKRIIKAPIKEIINIFS